MRSLKWKRTSMCLLHPCMTEFFESLMVELLSHIIVVLHVGVHTHVALSATRGKASPFLVFLFLLVPVFQPCFELVFRQLLRNDCSFWFFLQVPINRQATEGKITPFQSQKSHFVIPLKESQESSREKRKIGSEN